MLTRKQYELLRFISERLKESGVPPSFDEMKDALDLRSKSGIHRLITALEERGFIRRLPNRARAIEVIKLPDAMAEGGAGRRTGFSPNVIEGSRRPAPPPQLSSPPPGYGDARGVSVPLMGRIAAGVPISAIQNHTQDIAVPPEIMGTGEHFALEVKGDSMIEAGILDGDLVIVQRAQDARNGEIVVALVGDDESADEATVKTFYKEKGRVRLQPENASMKPIYAPHVQVIGRVVGVFREL